jgi:hypothetical protein
MPNKLCAAIKDYINSDTAKQGNDNSWGLVLDWLLCVAQAKANGASVPALSVDAICMADNDEFQEWMSLCLTTLLGPKAGRKGTCVHPQPPPTHGRDQTATSTAGVVAIISCSIVAVVQTLMPAVVDAAGGGG